MKMRTRQRTASLTTLGELKRYFSSPPWSGVGWSGDRFEGSLGLMDVKISPSTTVYDLHVEAVEDPSDSEDVSTEEPARALAEFLGRDIPGSEHFEKMSSDPDFFADALEALASVIRRGLFSRVRASSFIRRLASIPAVFTVSSDERDDSVSDLEKEMKGKGWKVRRRDSDGFPALEVDVHGIYKAVIEVDSVLYQYVFSYRGTDEADRSGVTDDPIREYRGWTRSPEVEALRAESGFERRKRREQQTVPA